MAEMTRKQKSENSKRLRRLEDERGHKLRKVGREFVRAFNLPMSGTVARHPDAARSARINADHRRDRSLRKDSTKDVKKYVSKLEKEKAKKEKKAKRKSWLKRAFDSALKRKKK